MDLVIDVNVLFSALIKRGKTEELLFKEAFHLFAPEFLFDEFEAYRERILEKTYDWTAALSSYGELVDLGSADRDGVDVNNDYPGLRYDYLGVVSLR